MGNTQNSSFGSGGTAEKMQVPQNRQEQSEGGAGQESSAVAATAETRQASEV